MPVKLPAKVLASSDKFWRVYLYFTMPFIFYECSESGLKTGPSVVNDSSEPEFPPSSLALSGGVRQRNVTLANRTLFVTFPDETTPFDLSPDTGIPTAFTHARTV